MRAHANQNAQVQFVQTKDAHVLFVQIMMHTTVDYVSCAPNLHFMSLIFCAHAGYFACIFKNVSSRVVASRVCSQV